MSFKINDVIVISKPLNLSDVVDEALSKTRSLDPNETSEHLHFGSLLEKSDKSSTHYFCQPEGEEGKKSWTCYWFIQESFGS